MLVREEAKRFRHIKKFRDERSHNQVSDKHRLFMCSKIMSRMRGDLLDESYDASLSGDDPNVSFAH